MMKNKKMLYGGIVVVSAILIYYLLKGESPITLITGGGKKGETPKPTGFDPIALAEADPTFKAEVKILQTKLNAYVKAKNLKYPALKVDGKLGEKTLGLIGNVFGTEMLPLINKIQVKYFISQLN
jgi:hypothetical protein